MPILQYKLEALTENKIMPKWILGWCLETSKDGIYLYDKEYDKRYKDYFKNYNEDRFKEGAKVIDIAQKLA